MLPLVFSSIYLDPLYFLFSSSSSLKHFPSLPPPSPPTLEASKIGPSAFVLKHTEGFLHQILTFWYFLLELCLGGVPTEVPEVSCLCR